VFASVPERSPNGTSAAGAIHRGEQELPWADAGHGIELKVVMVRDDDALWIVRNRFAPGAAVQTHRHTGPVVEQRQLTSDTARAFPGTYELPRGPQHVG
jgi:anti-sigma factor ChrR (cupin superfamily)